MRHYTFITKTIAERFSLPGTGIKMTNSLDLTVRVFNKNLKINKNKIYETT